MSRLPFDAFFHKATGKPTPYAYQCRLACGEQNNRPKEEWLTDGTSCQSQLINIPTGLGKTAAVVLAWLWNRVHLQKADWPRRLVYCLPMRTLVEQTEYEVKGWLKNLSNESANLNIQGQSPTDLKRLAEHSPVILMGGEELSATKREWDTQPEQPVILIGTQDMLLSRALNRGYGMSRYRWPMHFGLLNNDSLWVMDETQLMGPGLWTSGQLDWMRQYRFGVLKPCFTWWMSATPSPVFLDTLDRRKNNAPMMPVVNIGSDAAALSRLNPTRPLSFWKGTMPKVKGRKRGVPPSSFADSLVAAIRAKHEEGTLSLVVCNSVKTAQELYRTLGCENAVLLTSRFRRSDRNEHTKRLLAFEDQRKAVAKQNPRDDTILKSPGLICISTQVVEAGVDISARNLWMELAPWSSALQRLGRLNRDGCANSKAQAFVFEWPEESKKSKGQPVGPYEAKDVEISAKLLTKLATIYEAEPTLGAKDAIDKLRSIHKAEMDIALTPKDEPFPRAMDVHGLFSTEPDIFGGFTDVSAWVRGADRNADITVFWREFDAKKGPGKSDALTGPAFDPVEGCSVAIHRFREFLDKGRALVWDERAEQWQSLWPGDVCPGMVVMLPRTAGGYSETLGWTGKANDKLNDAQSPGRFNDTLEDDAESEQAGWVPLDVHLADVKAAATRLADALQLEAAHRTAIITAAELHDIGKAHKIWQDALPHSGDTSKNVWAKAPFIGRFLPRPSPDKPCIRHEAASALAAWHQYFKAGAEWPALTLFLIACHHGKVRTVLYARGEDGEDVCGLPKQPTSLPWAGGMPMDFSCATSGTSGQFSDDGLTFIPSSSSWTGLVADLLGGWEKHSDQLPQPIALRTASEPRLLGPFVLAFLEAVIRAADANPTCHV